MIRFTNRINQSQTKPCRAFFLLSLIEALEYTLTVQSFLAGIADFERTGSYLYMNESVIYIMDKSVFQQIGNQYRH